jgi:DNA-binding NarL/FixJ family response regulator
VGIRVVIADDQRLQRDGFRMILDSQDDIEVVGEAGDGKQALALLRRGPVDVLLMDIEMPRMNGLVAAGRVGADERVLAQGRAPRVILLTAVDVDDHLVAAATAGAFAVLYKDTPPEALLSAIRDAAIGDAAL